MSGLSADDVLRVLRAAISAHIPSSRAVPLSINNGTPDHVMANRDHPVSKAIVRFADERTCISALFSTGRRRGRGPTGPLAAPALPAPAGERQLARPARAVACDRCWRTTA